MFNVGSSISLHVADSWHNITITNCLISEKISVRKEMQGVRKKSSSTHEVHSLKREETVLRGFCKIRDRRCKRKKTQLREEQHHEFLQKP